MSYSAPPPVPRPPPFPAQHPIIVQSPSHDATMMMRYDANKKSVLVAYLLLFFLGGLGMHRFYLGRTGSGVALLLINIASWLLLLVLVGAFGLAIVGIWIVVDAFLIPGMTEAYNNRLIGQLRAGPAAGW